MANGSKRKALARMGGKEYITEPGKKAAVTYKYRGSDRSLIYKYIGSPLAQWLVDTCVPSWLAPNTITLMGLFLIVLSWSVLGVYCPDYECEADTPSWVYYLASWCLMWYSILDNMDGKQARATGSSSPLGLLFDHGCDAINTCVFSTMNALCAAQAGASPTSVLMMWTAFAGVFYISTWEEFHLKELVLPLINGPNEGIVVVCIMFIINGFFGNQFHFEKVPLPFLDQFTVSQVLVWSALFFGVTTMGYQIINVCWQLAGDGSSWVRPIARLMPMVIITATAWFWVLTSPFVLESHPRLFLGTIGCLCTDSVSKLMVSHVCEQKYRPNYFVIVGFALIPVTIYALRTNGVEVSSNAEYSALVIGSFVVIGALCTFIFYATNGLADALGVKIFRITPKSRQD